MMVDRRVVVAVAAGLALLAAVPASGAGDWNRLDDPMLGGLGIHAGRIGGTGLAFKWPLQWWLQLQAAGGVWNTEKNHRHSLGVEVQYLLRQDPGLRLYLLSGYGYYARSKLVDDAASDGVWQRDSHWNTGFGVGVERLMGERWSLKIDLAFTYRDDKESTTLWPQLGLFYYW